MKLDKFFPTFRNVLFCEVTTPQETKGGIVLPSKDLFLKDYSSEFENERVIYDGSKVKIGDYVVAKTGKDCTEIQVGDKIVLLQGWNPQKIELDGEEYFQVSEQQIVGYERE